jgi:sulfate adenylyltransferase subunit 2
MPKTPSAPLIESRRRAVELRLAGRPLAEVRAETGLSAPTIIEACRVFAEGGWEALDQRRRGRPVGARRALNAADEARLIVRLSTMDPSETRPSDDVGLWTADGVAREAQEIFGVTLGGRALSRVLNRAGLGIPTLAERAADDAAMAEWRNATLVPLIKETRRLPGEILWCGECRVGESARVLVAQTLRGQLAWLPLAEPFRLEGWLTFLDRVMAAWPNARGVLLHGIDVTQPELRAWAAKHSRLRLVGAPRGPGPISIPASRPAARRAARRSQTRVGMTPLQRLEAESIHIMREVVAETEQPVLLYTGGKDSAVMLHVARKAFFPSPLPFPLLHIDSTWEFREMYAMRERIAREYGLRLIVHRNPEAVRLGINPFTHGSQVHADQWNTEGLRQALDEHGFDAAFGGARRDEEKSRAKERVFSFRNAHHRWDPRNQRPELWNLYNARKAKGESIRVFPLSNWTELDVWQYILLEQVPIVPLYLAKERPVVERHGMLILVDDERLPLQPGEVPVIRKVRFRTLGCYPLSGAIESAAETLPEIIAEMQQSTFSERQGRLIDHDGPASMERKKREGYF